MMKLIPKYGERLFTDCPPAPVVSIKTVPAFVLGLVPARGWSEYASASANALLVGSLVLAASPDATILPVCV